jgi:putative protease
VIHFYNGICVAVVKFKKDIKKGSKILFKGATTNFEQILDSIQINHRNVVLVKKNQIAGVKVKKRVREGDKLYLKF